MHSIRLRGPWTSEWLEQEPGWTASYTRSFHRPTGLQSGQSIHLALEFVEGNTLEFTPQLKALGLNDQSLSFSASVRMEQQASVDLTELLQPFNRLQVCLGFEPLSSRPQVSKELANAPEPPRLTDLLSVSLIISE